MSLGYLNVCRLCAGSCKNSIPIFGKPDLLNFAEKIKSYLHIEIEYSSNGKEEPRMCSTCYQKIVNWDEYAEQVHKVQGMFMSLSSNQDNNLLMDNFEQEVSSIIQDDIICKGSQNFMNDEVPLNEVETNESSVKEKKKGKHKDGRKKMKASTKRQSNCSDFGSEDEVPLANHLSQSTGTVKNKLKEKPMKKVKPRIKLKIKAIKEKEPGEPENGNLGDIQERRAGDVAMANGERDETENSLDDDGDEDDEDSNEPKMDGLQSLFTWECLECHAPVKNWNALVKHCKVIHDCNASVQCVCGKFLQSRASIMKHRTKHTIGYEYKCEFENCNKTFHRQQLLDVHSLSHMPKELQPWMCCKCSRRFHTESLLKQHEKVHLPKEEKLIHPCEVCQKKFCSKSAVSAHIRAVHFGERPFVCDQCGHSFTSKGILHEHLTIHSDVYNFHCKDCNKSFKTKYRLKIHMDTHVETRYQCPICTLTLNTRRTLRMHLLVHRDDKAFQCTTCGKAFKRSKDLKNHYNLHTGRRPYTCPFCQRTFANGSNCRSHKRRMHPEELKIYEAALAAGQQPELPKSGRGAETEAGGNPQPDKGPEVPEDSNESNSNVSDLHRRYSDDDVKYLPYDAKTVRLDVGVELGGENVADLASPDFGAEYGKAIKEEEEEEGGEDKGLVGTIELAAGGEGNGETVSNFTQISFAGQNMQYPVHNFYTFQPSGIPAFPGNPFFRQ